MYNLDKESNIIPTKTQIINLAECEKEYNAETGEEYGRFNTLDIDFRMPVSFGKVLVNDGIDHHEQTSMNISLNRLSVEFSRLETEQQILAFSKKYGLLGLGKATKNISYLDDRRELHLYIRGFRYEHTYVEPLRLWYWHIKHVKKLLQLARALSKLQGGKDIEIEEKLLYVGDSPHPTKDLNNEKFHLQYVYWNDHEDTTFTLFFPNYSFKKVAMNVLVQNITSMLKEAVNIDPIGFTENKSSIYGFKIQESRSTNYLLAAIYYDLWQMIAKDEPIKTCLYIKCGKPFRAVGRKKFCNDSCRVSDFNSKKGGNENGS